MDQKSTLMFPKSVGAEGLGEDEVAELLAVGEVGEVTHFSEDCAVAKLLKNQLFWKQITIWSVFTNYPR